MKKTILLLSIISFITLTSSMCEKDDDESSSSSNNVSNIILNRSWKITYFNDSGTDKTSFFSGFSFTFNNNGSVTAVNNLSSVNGTWSEGKDDSQSKLFLSFSSSPFNELTDD